MTCCNIFDCYFYCKYAKVTLYMPNGYLLYSILNITIRKPFIENVYMYIVVYFIQKRKIKSKIPSNSKTMMLNNLLILLL